MCLELHTPRKREEIIKGKKEWVSLLLSLYSVNSGSVHWGLWVSLWFACQCLWDVIRSLHFLTLHHRRRTDQGKSQKHPSGEQRRDTHKAGPNYAGLMATVDCRLVVVDEESCRSRKAVCVAQLWLLANSSSFALSHNESAPILPKLQRLCWSVYKRCWKWYNIPAHTLVAVDGPVTACSLAEAIAAPKSTNQTAS